MSTAAVAPAEYHLLFRSEMDGKVWPLVSRPEFMASMERLIDGDVKSLTSQPIRDVFRTVKAEGLALKGMRVAEANRRKAINRYKKKRLHDAEIAYSKSVSSQSTITAEERAAAYKKIEQARAERRSRA